MRELKIDEKTKDMRLDKVLRGYLKSAGEGFVQKMLRKKNIVVNGKKQSASYRVREGDVITLWLSDDTIRTMQGGDDAILEGLARCRHAYDTLRGEDDIKIGILHEDEDVLLLNKPVGVLSQRAFGADESVNEWAIGYLLHTGAVDEETLRICRPSVANRLDRGTSGLLIFTRHVTAAREVSAMLSEKLTEKHYLAVVSGHAPGTGASSGITYTRLALSDKEDLSLLDVTLLEGKKHQIRQSLSGAGLPVAGDTRYGNTRLNQRLLDTFGINAQLLHARSVRFPEAPACRLSGIEGRAFTAPLPGKMRRMIQQTFARSID
ncbi:MAG: RluA family pseudouridine synthase [Lachnospiraceae bacterium]|nr:RluA family pseudouridine synthase [Lachnospiraceae bacterium]